MPPEREPAAAVDLPVPTLGPPAAVSADAVQLRFTGEDGREYDVWCLDVGLACCAVEFAATAMRSAGTGSREGGADAGPLRAGVLVVSGTVTHKIAPAVLALYQRLPEPRYVISLGACANSGGPYWDSYCVTKGVDSLFPVDVYVPGCPPRPEALQHGLVRLQQVLTGEGSPAPEPLLPVGEGT